MLLRAKGSVQALYIAVTFLLIGAMAARTPLDSDLFWHLRAGEETVRAGSPLLVDLFSHTRSGTPWINHSWLSQVGLYLLYEMGGYLALSVAVVCGAVVSMALMWRQCQGPVILRAAATILGSVVASVVWVPRPQLVSLVLFALVSYLLYLYKWQGRDRLWLLPVIFLLWSNLHGGYPLGFMLIVALLAGEGLNHLLGYQESRVLPWKNLGSLCLWAGLSAVLLLVNPNGLDVWRIPFQTVNVGALQQFIDEWASPDFHQPLQQAFLWLLFAVFAAVALAGKGMDATDLVMVIGFGYLALVARRNFGPFALAAVPILTRYATCAIENWQRRVSWPAWANRLWCGGVEDDVENIAANRLKKAVNLMIFALLALVAVGKLYVVSHPALVEGFIAQQYPVRAVDWLSKNQIPGSLLNEYNWGGYLQWSLRGWPVFVDGRTDLFGDEIIGEWVTVVQAQEGWEKILAERQIDVILLEPGRPIVEHLQAKGWQLSYQDEQAVIYASPNGN